ncbi:hypothetical protein BHM03_00011556, partial [Ensete ventricosum]
IGDETFTIAALMAMRHPKSIVLSGALMALLRMSQGFPIVEILVLLHFLSQSLLYVVSSASLSVLLAVSFQYYLSFQVLSTGLGRIVPNLISRKHTNSAATGKYFPLGVSLGWTADLMKTLITVLYAFLGLRLLYIAWRSDSKTSQKKEMEEVEEKLESGQREVNIAPHLFKILYTNILGGMSSAIPNYLWATGTTFTCFLLWF